MGWRYGRGMEGREQEPGQLARGIQGYPNRASRVAASEWQVASLSMDVPYDVVYSKSCKEVDNKKVCDNTMRAPRRASRSRIFLAHWSSYRSLHM